MQEIITKSSNMMSVIMGKDIYLPWRGQSNVVVNIPYEEWKDFIKGNINVLRNRTPLDYEKILSSDKELLSYRYFMFDCGWSLYNEVMISANVFQSATAILPSFIDGNNILFDSIISTAESISRADMNKYISRYTSANPKCCYVPIETLSNWNFSLLLLSLHIQSFAYSKCIEKINIRME